MGRASECLMIWDAARTIFSATVSNIIMKHLSSSHPTRQEIEPTRFSPNRKKVQKTDVTAANQAGHFSPSGKSLASLSDEFQNSEEPTPLPPALLQLLLKCFFRKALATDRVCLSVSSARGYDTTSKMIYPIAS